MKANVGTLERSLRIAAGLILIALSLAGQRSVGLDRCGATGDRHLAFLPGVSIAGYQHLQNEMKHIY